MRYKRAPRCTGRSISKSITNTLLILLILLILRFPGSTAFCISTCISRMLILAAVVHLKRHVQVGPSRDGRLSRQVLVSPSRGPAAAASLSARAARATVPVPDAVLRVCRLWDVDYQLAHAH
jgi:hypothetical protein